MGSPLTDADIARMRSLIDGTARPFSGWASAYAADVPRLLAEVARLSAQPTASLGIYHLPRPPDAEPLPTMRLRVGTGDCRTCARDPFCPLLRRSDVSAWVLDHTEDDARTRRPGSPSCPGHLDAPGVPDAP